MVRTCSSPTISSPGVSFPVDIPSRIAAAVAVDFERSSEESLFLDPFALQDGALVWDGNTPDNDLDDEWTS